MRLLNTRTLEFEDFSNSRKPLPPFAILSHVWLHGQEVSYIEFLAKTRTDSIGYRKIETLCSLARNEAVLALASGIDGSVVVRERTIKDENEVTDDAAMPTGSNSYAGLRPLDYCWIDTCCINKESTSEVSEAVTSMYRWYRQAAVCFVFMPDVDPVPDKGSVHSIDGTGSSAVAVPYSKEQLIGSKWFLRGWTLQELVASRLRIFLNTSFEVFGWLGPYAVPSQLPLLSTIEEVTQIPASVLTDVPLEPLCSSFKSDSHVSVAQVMSWASNRQTTREEDIAYCLFGMFGVSPHLAYGEGAKSAFRRLQEAILNACRDDSIFAWQIEDRDDVPGVRDWPRHTLGFLAPSPVAFKDCHRVINSDSRAAKSFYKLTSRGVEFHVQIPEKMRPRNSNCWMYILRLRCYVDRSDPSKRKHARDWCYLKLIVRPEDELDRTMVARRIGCVLRANADFDSWDYWRKAQKQAFGWRSPRLLNLTDFETNLYRYIHFEYDAHPFRERLRRCVDILKTAKLIQLYVPQETNHLDNG